MIQVRNTRILSLTVLATGALMMTTSALLPASPQDDAKAVAVLDTEYQTAVKNNDATTMDRILADDFILVTGRGKVYHKADLLKSARDKDAVYEHPGGHRADRARLGRYGGHHCIAMGKGNTRGQRVRL